MPSNTIARFAPLGPTGRLERMPDQPASILESDPPAQHRSRYLDDPERGVWSSVWDSAPLKSRLHPYSFNEVMLVREGSVMITDTSGRKRTFHAGDCFIFHAGLVIRWDQTEYFKKFSFGFKDPAWQQPPDPSLQVIVIDPSQKLEAATITPPKSLLSPAPIQHAHEWFADPTGQFAVGVWDSTAFESKPLPSTRHEWTHLLDGSVELTDEANEAHKFTAGETFLVPFGAVCGWRCTDHLRAIYGTFLPNAAAQAQAAE